MPIIQFRVWDINGKVWLDDDYIYVDQEGEIHLIEERTPAYQTYMHKENITEKVSAIKYTGLKDKNGKEIYEGDILKRIVTVIVYGTENPPEDIDEYLHVEYRDEYAGFYIGERPLFAYVDTTRDVDTGCRCTKAEVIGNIYENPELLEQ